MTADAFKAFRERMGLTRRDLAVALGIDRKTGRRFEEGEARIPRHIALACAALAHGLPPL